MSQAQLPYVLLYLCSTFLSSVSQVLLKKAALREQQVGLGGYTDWRVILGYALFVGCTLLTMLAYKGVPLNVGPVLEATGYIYVTIFRRYDLPREDEPKKLAALAMIFGRHPCICAVTKTSCLQHCADRTFFGHLEFLWFSFARNRKERTYVLSITAFPVRGARGLHRASLQNGGGMIQQQRQQQAKHHVNDTVLLEQYRGQRIDTHSTMAAGRIQRRRGASKIALR